MVFRPRSLGSAPGQGAGGHAVGLRAVNGLAVIASAHADQTITFKYQGGVAVPDSVALIEIHAVGQVEKDGIVAAAVIEACDAGGALGHIVDCEELIVARPQAYASVGGALGYVLDSSIIIDVVSVEGGLSYSLSSSISAHSQNNTAIEGTLGYTLESGITATSHIAVSVGGTLQYELESSIEATSSRAGQVGSELGYVLESGISMYASPQVDVGGILGYVLSSGISADSGAACSGVLSYSRGTVC